MKLRITHGSVIIALALSIGLIALPACKKSKSKPTTTTDPEPIPAPVPPPGTNPNTVERDPSAPRSPVFRNSDPRVAAIRIVADNNMKEIMLAMHGFHDTYRAFPAGYADKNGKPGLSWRVAILPFIDQQNLFSQFKLDEPWDSPNNKALISKMPKIFAPPNTESNGYTFYRGFVGEGTWMTPPGPARPVQPGQPILGVNMNAISDGRSNTILVAEAYDPVIWTKPDEMTFSPGNPPRLGGVFASGAFVGMGDCSVRFLKNFEPKRLSNAIQINDGNIINLDD